MNDHEQRRLAENILKAKTNIAAFWRKSADNRLHIGFWLKFLHRVLSPEEFSEYMSNDVAGLGISRSSAYRWMVLGAKLERLFPNTIVCNALMSLCDGRGIFADFRVRDNAAPSETPLTVAAREALAGLPAPPHGEEGNEKANEWAKSFIHAMNRIRARQRAEKCAAGKTNATQGESLLKKLKDFAADVGAEEFEKFREQMDRFFGPRTVEAKAERHAAPPMVQPEVKVQSQVETESKAETEPASVQGEERHPVSQSQLGTGIALAAQAPGQPAVVDGGKGAKPLSPSSSSSAQSMPATPKGRSAAGKSFFQSQLGTDSMSLPQALLAALGIRTRRDDALKGSPEKNL